jgi:hypothetical protein
VKLKMMDFMVHKDVLKGIVEVNQARRVKSFRHVTETIVIASPKMIPK